jgi:hypothetical protein
VTRSRAGFRGGRRVTNAAKKYQILVFTEGEKTEPLYLSHWHRIYREKVVVTIDDLHVDPFSLVKAAVSRKEGDEREAKRGRGDPYNEYWCAFDIDEHPRILEAVALAGSKGIFLAISNPCVELWFALHFKDVRSHIHRHDIQREVRNLFKCEKVLTLSALEILVRDFEQAKDRAILLDKKHIGDGSKPGTNPSTRMWTLVDAIRGATPKSS